jgi:hypothetical protein
MTISIDQANDFVRHIQRGGALEEYLLTQSLVLFASMNRRREFSALVNAYESVVRNNALIDSATCNPDSGGIVDPLSDIELLCSYMDGTVKSNNGRVFVNPSSNIGPYQSFFRSLYGGHFSTASQGELPRCIIPRI